MNSPEKIYNTGLFAGIALLFGGTLALVTGRASLKGHTVQGPLAVAAGTGFVLLGLVFLALHIRARIRNR